MKKIHIVEIKKPLEAFRSTLFDKDLHTLMGFLVYLVAVTKHLLICLLNDFQNEQIVNYMIYYTKKVIAIKLIF